MISRCWFPVSFEFSVSPRYFSSPSICKLLSFRLRGPNSFNFLWQVNTVIVTLLGLIFKCRKSTHFITRFRASWFRSLIVVLNMPRVMMTRSSTYLRTQCPLFLRSLRSKYATRLSRRGNRTPPSGHPLDTQVTNVSSAIDTSTILSLNIELIQTQQVSSIPLLLRELRHQLLRTLTLAWIFYIYWQWTFYAKTNNVCKPSSSRRLIVFL